MADTHYSFKASGQRFEIIEKYSFIRPIGHGAYGVVISAHDNESQQDVAIKKISPAFHNTAEATRILREIKLMKMFSHDNVVRLIDLIPPCSKAEQFEEIYIVQDLMETDLHRVIYSKQQLSIDHVQYFMKQILRGLTYIHSANVMHRDLKPANILVNSNCDIKICDFGLARELGVDNDHDFTEYVVTRWYRSPELLLGAKDYTASVDIWSVGCIFAELLTRRPLFAGSNHLDQLRLICDKLGSPTDFDLSFVTSAPARRFLTSLPRTQPLPMEELFSDNKHEVLALDILAKMLSFNFASRISSKMSLEHKFFDSLRADSVEDLSPDFTLSSDIGSAAITDGMSIDDIKALVWAEIRSMHPEMPEQHPERRLTNSAQLWEEIRGVVLTGPPARKEDFWLDGLVSGLVSRCSSHLFSVGETFLRTLVENRSPQHPMQPIHSDDISDEIKFSWCV